LLSIASNGSIGWLISLVVSPALLAFIVVSPTYLLSVLLGITGMMGETKGQDKLATWQE